MAMIYVNIAGFPNLPQLYPGDVIEAAFVPPENTVDQVDEVTQIERVQLADWGIWLEVSDVTAEGLELWVYRNSGIDRVHHISGTCTLERRNGALWESVYVGAAGESARLAGGNPYRKKIRWTELCGVLEPGTYRLSKEVSHFESNQTRSYCVEFSIDQPLTSTLEDAVSQTARYILSKQLVNPTAAHDKTLEHIKQGQDTGFLDNPSTSEPAGITFQQMVQSYQILDHQQEGNVHTVSVLGLCRGYNNRVLADEFFSPMLMVLEESPAGKFTVTSCKLPTQLYWQADIEFLFPEEIAKRIKENWHDRDSLEAACDKQVTGGVIELRGFGVTLAEGELNTTLILQAISHGKPYSGAYTDTANCTLYLGDTVYYYNLKTGICHNVIDGTTVVLTEEGRETVYAVLNAPE